MNTAVEAFTSGVGNEVLEVVEDVWQEVFEHLGFLLHRSQIALLDPSVPSIKEPPGPAWQAESPDALELFFQSPRSCGLEVQFFEEVKGRQMGIIEFFFFEEP